MKDYLADHYGTCTAEKCRCLRPGNPWLGRRCEHWVPVGVGSWEELRAIGAKMYGTTQPNP